MRIQVTAEHINIGKRLDCFYCPVAIAIREALNNSIYIHATEHIIVIGDIKYQTPTSVFDFITYFDKGIILQPFEFELNL